MNSQYFCIAEAQPMFVLLQKHKTQFYSAPATNPEKSKYNSTVIALPSYCVFFQFLLKREY